MAIFTCMWPLFHIAQFSAIARAGQHGRQNPHHHGQSDALELPNRHQQAINRLYGIGRRHPVRIHGPPFWQGQSFLFIYADFPMCRAGKCRVKNNGKISTSGNRHAQRIDTQNPLGPSPWGHCGQSIGRHNPNHIAIQRHTRKIPHRTAVITPPNTRGRHADIPSACNHLLHRKRRPNLPHRIAPIHHETRPIILHDLGLAVWIYPFHRQLPHVFGHAQYPVRMHPAEVRIHQRIRQQMCISCTHPTRFKNGLHQIQQRPSSHARFVLHCAIPQCLHATCRSSYFPFKNFSGLSASGK